MSRYSKCRYCEAPYAPPGHVLCEACEFNIQTGTLRLIPVELYVKAMPVIRAQCTHPKYDTHYDVPIYVSCKTCDMLGTPQADHSIVWDEHEQ